MNRKPGILLIDANDWDREHVRGLLGGLSTEVVVVPARELDEPGARVDVIILGFTDAVALETSRAQLEKARSRFPQAQLILCAPPDMKGLDNKVIELKARAFLLKPLEEETFVALLDATLPEEAKRACWLGSSQSARRSKSFRPAASVPWMANWTSSSTRTPPATSYRETCRLRPS